MTPLLAKMTIEGKSYDFRTNMIYTVGSCDCSDGCEIDIIISGSSVDHKHAAIDLRTNAIKIVDLVSQFGTYVGDREIEALETVDIKENCVIKFGGVPANFMIFNGDESQESQKDVSEDIIDESPEKNNNTDLKSRTLRVPSSSQNASNNKECNYIRRSFSQNDTDKVEPRKSFEIPGTQFLLPDPVPLPEDDEEDDCFIPETQEFMAAPANGNDCFDISSQVLNDNLQNPSQNLLDDFQSSVVIPRISNSPIKLVFDATIDEQQEEEREMTKTPDLETSHVAEDRDNTATPDLDHEGNIIEDTSNISQESNKENSNEATQKFQKKGNFETPESTQMFKNRIVATQAVLGSSDNSELQKTMRFERRESANPIIETTQEFNRRIVSTQQVLGDQETELENQHEDPNCTMLNTQAFKARLSSTMLVSEDEPISRNASKKAPIILAPDSDEENSGYNLVSNRNPLLHSSDEEDDEVSEIVKIDKQHKPRKSQTPIFTQPISQFMNTPMFGDFMIVPPKDLLTNSKDRQDTIEKQLEAPIILENIQISAPLTVSPSKIKNTLDQSTEPDEQDLRYHQDETAIITDRNSDDIISPAGKRRISRKMSSEDSSNSSKEAAAKDRSTNMEKIDESTKYANVTNRRGGRENITTRRGNITSSYKDIANKENTLENTKTDDSKKIEVSKTKPKIKAPRRPGPKSRVPQPSSSEDEDEINEDIRKSPGKVEKRNSDQECKTKNSPKNTNQKERRERSRTQAKKDLYDSPKEIQESNSESEVSKETSPDVEKPSSKRGRSRTRAIENINKNERRERSRTQPKKDLNDSPKEIQDSNSESEVSKETSPDVEKPSSKRGRSRTRAIEKENTQSKSEKIKEIQVSNSERNSSSDSEKPKSRSGATEKKSSKESVLSKDVQVSNSESESSKETTSNKVEQHKPRRGRSRTRGIEKEASKESIGHKSGNNILSKVIQVSNSESEGSPFNEAEKPKPRRGRSRTRGIEKEAEQLKLKRGRPRSRSMNNEIPKEYKEISEHEKHRPRLRSRSKSTQISNPETGVNKKSVSEVSNTENEDSQNSDGDNKAVQRSRSRSAVRETEKGRRGKSTEPATLKEKPARRHTLHSDKKESTNGRKRKTLAEGSSEGSSSKKPLKPVFVIFTGVRSDLVQNYKTDIKSDLPISFVNDIKKADILITSKLARTQKLLYAMAKGLPILTVNYLDYVIKKESVPTNFRNFFLVDEESEQKYKFSMVSTIEKAKAAPLFDGLVFCMTPETFPDNNILKDIITAAGGKVLKTPPKSKSNLSVILVSSEEDSSLWNTYKKHCSVLKIINGEGIMVALMRYELCFEEYLLEDI